MMQIYWRNVPVNEQDEKTKRANVTGQRNVPRRRGRQRGGGTLS